MRSIFSFVALLIFSVNVFATHVAVLETGSNENAKENVSLTDRQYLTNVLREQAVLELPAEENYTIMTRENINAMLPPGKAIEDCEGSCLAETGRNISADYICQAHVGRFGSKLTLSAELYETAGNKLIASFNGRGADVEELLELIKEMSPKFFRRVKELNQPMIAPALIENPVKEDSVSLSEDRQQDVVFVEETSSDSSSSVILAKSGISLADSVRVEAATAYDEIDGKEASRVGESIPVNEEKSRDRKIHWIPLSVSAVALVGGVVLAIIGNNKAKDASEKDYATRAEFEKNREDAKLGQTVRTVGTGITAAGLVGFGLCFVF